MKTHEQMTAEAGFAGTEFAEAAAIRRKLGAGSPADLSPEESARWTDLGPKWRTFARIYDEREAQHARQQQAEASPNAANPSGELGKAVLEHARSHSRPNFQISGGEIVQRPTGLGGFTYERIDTDQPAPEYRGSAGRGGAARIAAGLAAGQRG